MGLNIRHVTKDDHEDEDGFWYHTNPDQLGGCPIGLIDELNLLTVGWKRFSDGNRTREVIRLPAPYRWLEVGTAQISNGGSDFGRTVRVPRDYDGRVALNGHSIFDPNGYLTKYFIERDGQKRIQRL